MIENYNVFLLVCGIAFLFGALFPIAFKHTPISLPMLQVSFGLLIGYWWTTLSFLDPIDNGLIIEKLTEIVVLVSLVGAGIKIDTELSCGCGDRRLGCCSSPCRLVFLPWQLWATMLLA